MQGNMIKLNQTENKKTNSKESNFKKSVIS
jgi:hypothetical protein